MAPICTPRAEFVAALQDPESFAILPAGFQQREAQIAQSLGMIRATAQRGTQRMDGVLGIPALEQR